jgi:hypothetical protein
MRLSREVTDLRGQVRLPKAPQDEEKSIVSYDQVSFANFKQLEDFMILLLETDDWVN